MVLHQLLLSKSLSQDGYNGSVALPLSDQQQKATIASRGHVLRTTRLWHPCRHSQADTTVDRGEANAPSTQLAKFGLPPLFGFKPSPLMSGPLIMGEV